MNSIQALVENNERANTFASCLRAAIKSRNVSVRNVANIIKMSARGLRVVINTNRVSRRNYEKILQLFPELKYAPVPEGRDFKHKRLVATVKRHKHLPNKPLLTNPNNEVQKTLVKKVDNRVDGFSLAESIMKIRGSDSIHDLKSVFEVMIDKGYSAEYLYDYLNK